jgi:hypothetical protein
VTQTPQDEEDFQEALRRCGSNTTLLRILEMMQKVKEEREKKEK